MRIIGERARSKRARSGKDRSGTAEEEAYLVDEHSRVRSQIRELEGFMEAAPEIRERRYREASVTLPPPEDDSELPPPVSELGMGELDDGDEEDLQERYGRRHLAAIRRAHRRNFLVFLASATVVGAFLYWVSLVVQ